MTSLFLGGGGVKNLEKLTIHNFEKSGDMVDSEEGSKSYVNLTTSFMNGSQIVEQHHSVVVLNGF